MDTCGVCKKEFDTEKDGGIKQDDKVVCATCVRNHLYQTNRILK